MPVDVTENYIRIRVRMPSDFQEDSFRTITLSESEGIKAIIGKPKGESSTQIQSILFDKKKWNVSEAKKWVKNHGYKIKFVNYKDVKIKDFSGMITKAYVEKDSKGVDRKYIEVVVTGKRIDRDKEMMGDKAIQKFMEKLKSGKMPIFSNHGRDEYGNRVYRWQDILGKGVDAYLNGPDLVAKIQLNEANPDAQKLWEYVHENEMPVAFSIGAKPLKSKKIRLAG